MSFIAVNTTDRAPKSDERETVAHRFTQREIAEAIGCTHQYIYELERRALAKFVKVWNEHERDGWKALEEKEAA